MNSRESKSLPIISSSRTVLKVSMLNTCVRRMKTSPGISLASVYFIYEVRTLGKS